MSYTVNTNRPVQVETTSKRIGVAEGKFVVSDDFDDCNDEIAEIFGVKDRPRGVDYE